MWDAIEMNKVAMRKEKITGGLVGNLVVWARLRRNSCVVWGGYCRKGSFGARLLRASIPTQSPARGRRARLK